MTKRVWLLVTAALAVGMLGGVALGRGLSAQQAAISRKVLLTTDSPGPAGHELIMALVEVAPGASAGRHRHPGIEIGYVIDGTLVVERDGRAAETVAAGQSFMNDGVHNPINRGSTPTKILAVFAVEKGKPLSEPAP